MSRMAKTNGMNDETPDTMGSEPRERHPSLETLAAYKDGRLSKEEEEDFERHLIDCDECVGMLVFDEPESPPKDSNVADFEKERNWRVVRAEIRAEKAAQTAAELQEGLREAHGEIGRLKQNAARRRRTSWLYAVAMVMLFVAPLGTMAATMSMKATALQEELAVLSAPQVNVAMLHAEISRTRQSGPPAPMDVTTEFFTVVIPVAGSPQESYRIQIQDDSGKEIWKGDGFKVAYGETRLGLSRRFLPAGVYGIRVFSEQDAQKPVADHSIDVRYLSK